MRSTVHEQPRALLTLLFALNFGLAIAEANTPQPLLHTLQRPPQSLKLDCYATAASSLLMRRAAGSYAFMRPDLLLTIQTVEDTPAVSGSQILFDHMQSGEADYAFSTLVPTDSQKEVAPDLMHYPAAAFPFGAIYSLPLLRSTLVLDIKTLARIYSGNITRWDDPAIQSLNPDALMPDRGIEVVLLGTSNNYIKAATASFRDADQDFANRIEESPTPHWPTSRYYKYTVVMGVDGPAVYVAAVPYSIGLSFLFQATAMQVRIANILKSDGTIVQPTFESIQSAFSDQAVKTVFDAEDGNIEVQQVDYVSDAPGQNSWPMMIQGTFTLAKEYSRSSCQQRTELIKFLLFMLDSETVQYVIAQKLLVALSSEELDSSIGLRAALQSDVKCEDLPINVGKTASTVTSVGYALLGSTHTNVRSLLISVYAVTEQSTQYSMVLLDELQQINLMLKANRNDELDIAWIFPVAFKHMYPGVIETSSIVNSLSYFPSAVIGVMPTYSLHPSILVQMQNMNALPLKIDLETLAGIFLGSISSWLDPAILAFNPKLSLAHQAETQVSTKIKLILFGKGKQSDAPLSALSNHLIIALNHTKTFKQSGIDWRLPADWTKVTDKLDATRYEYVTNEASLTTQISYNFGSIGYKLITSNTTDPTTDFDLIRTVHTFLGTQQSITIQGTPQSLINCLEAASIPDFDPLANIDLEAVINDQSYAGASCWPFFILNTLVLPTDVDSTALDQLGTDASNEQITRIRNNLCFHRTKVVQFMSWMAINPQLNIATSMLGRGGFTMSQRWITAMQNELRELKCLGKYMLHTPSIQWIVSPAIFQFVLIASSVGFFGILVSAFVVARFRKRTLIVSSDILLQACGLIGTALLLISAVLFVQPASPSLCSAVSWLLSLGLTATLAPQSLKMFKVYYTMTHVRRKRKPLFRTNDFTNCNMYYVIGSLLGIDIALLIAAQIPSTADGLLDPLSILHNKGLDVYQYTTCAPPSNSMPYAVPLIAIKALILLIGSWLAFKSRHVSSAFGESTKISWSLWSATVSGIIILPLIVLTGGTYDDLYVFLVCFFVLWLSLGSLFLQFGYKVLAIFNEMMEERAQNQRIASSHRSSNPSGTQSGTSTGTTGTNTGTGTGTGSLRDSGSLTATGSAATHMFPELNQVSIKLPTLERYINCLESELAKARQHRLKKFGSNGTATGAAYGLGPARLSADRVNANESKKLKLDIPAAENDMHFKSSNNIIISPSSRGTLSKGVKNSSFSSKLASPSAVQFMTPTPSVLLAGGTPSPSQSYSTAPAERRRITLRQSLSPSSAGGVRGPANSKSQSQPLPATGSSPDFILSDCQPMAASRSRFTTSITLPPSASSSSTAVVDPAPSPLSLNGSASEGNTQTWQMSKPPPSKGAKSAILLTPTVATSPNGSSSGSNSSTAQGVSSLVNAGAAIFRLRNLENTLHQLHVIASNASSSPHRSPATRHRSLKNPAPGAPDSIQETAELSSLGGGTKSTSTSGHHSRDNSAGSLNAHQAQSPSKSRSPGTIMSRLNIGVWTNPGTPPNNDVVAMRDSVNKTP